MKNRNEVWYSPEHDRIFVIPRMGRTLCPRRNEFGTYINLIFTDEKRIHHTTQTYFIGLFDAKSDKGGEG